MQNKIYTTLANIFNELKQAKGSSASLAEAIDEKVKGQQEIVEARDGYATLNDRLDDMKAKTSVNMSDIGVIKHDVDMLKNQPVNTDPAPTIVQMNGNEMIVRIEDRITYKEDNFVLLPGTQKLIVNDQPNVIVDAYRKTQDINAVKAAIEYTGDDVVKYDKERNVLSNNMVIPVATNNLYKLPFHTANVFLTEGLDSCLIPYVGTCIADYAASQFNEDGSQNWSNHLINALEGKGAIWTIKRSFVNVTFSLFRAIEVARVASKFASNSTVGKVTIQISNDQQVWTTLYTGSDRDLDYTLPTVQTAKYIRFSYNIFDNLRTNYQIDVSKISVYAYEYNKESGVITTVNPTPINDRSETLKIVQKSPTAKDPFLITRFAIANSKDNGENWVTYIPQRLTVMPDDFYDDLGYKYVGDSLTNNIKLNATSKYLFSNKNVYVNPLPTVDGVLGTATISEHASRTLDLTWKPYKYVFIRAYIKIDGMEYQIPISPDNLNRNISVAIAGYSLVLKITPLSNKVLKLYVWSELDKVIRLDEAKVVVDSAYRLYYPEWYDSHDYAVIYSSASSVDARKYINGYPIDENEIYTNYDVHRYSRWYGHSSDEGSSAFKGNEYTSIAIIPKDMYGGGALRSSVTKTNDGQWITHTYIRSGATLPVSMYLCGDKADVLNPVIESDTEGITGSSLQPRFEYKKDYTAKVYIANKKIVGIHSIQSVSDISNIQYSISFDGTNFYTYNNDTFRWDGMFDRGMTYTELNALNDSHFEQLRAGEWLYIKVRLISPDAKVDSIQIDFENDTFVSIHESEIIDKGMPARVLETINPSSLFSYITTKHSAIKLATAAMSVLPIYQYQLAGFDLMNYNDSQWQEIDPTTVIKYLLPNNNFIFKNITTSPQHVKVMRRIVSNQTAVIDMVEDAKQKLADLERQQNEYKVETDDRFTLMQQSIDLMYQSMQDGTPPPPLPSFILPQVREIDVPDLAPQGYYTVDKVGELRGVQVWEQKTSYVPFTEQLIFTKGNEDLFATYGVVLKDTGAEIFREYDITNVYEVPIGWVTSNNWSRMQGTYFDVTIDSNGVSTTSGSGIVGLFNDSYPTFTFQWYGVENLYDFHEIWTLPGEDKRMVDIILDFRQFRYINYMTACFGQLNGSQQTSFWASKDGLEFQEVARYTGEKRWQSIQFNRELRYIRVRLEIPYSVNRGAGRVSIVNMNIFWSPVNYSWGKEYYIYNKTPINTTHWLNFEGITADRYIDHNPAEMRFLLSDDPSQNIWKYWNGTKWITTQYIRLAEAMSIETLLSLTKEQLNQLERGSLTIAAIMRTDDRYKTPVLRSVSFKHDVTNEEFYTLTDTDTVDFRYYPETGQLTIVNNSSVSRKFKLIQM
jgi:hypothetical protein